MQLDFNNYDLLEKRIVNPLQRVPGVAKVELNGVAPREVRINLRLHKIAAHGVDIGAFGERIRPILMTAATAVLALVPMAVGRTELDGLYYYPLARTVIGGLTASTFLTLVILPYIYVLFDSLAVWARNVWRASEPAGVTTQTAEQG